MDKYKEYRWKWDNYPKRYYIERMPIHLDIELTTKCNLRCLVGNTLILMEDYKWKEIKDIRIGDYVISVKDNGKNNHLKYIRSKVTQIFPSINKEVFKLTLENDIYLIGTSDHLILNKSKRWIPMKNLTNNIPPKYLSQPYEYIENEDYLKGYLIGAWRSDGSYKKRKRSNGFNDYRAFFRVKDKTFIDFICHCLDFFGFKYKRKKLSWDHPCIKESLEITDKENYEKLLSMINLEIQNKDIAKGFLASFMDGDGSYDGNTLRFTNTYHDNIEKIRKSLEHLDFKYNIQIRNHKNRKYRDCYNIRILGGQKEKYRFFMLCNPKIPRKRRISQTVYGTINIKNIEVYGKDFVYNIETEYGNFIANGLIVHNCIMCEHSFNPPKSRDIPFNRYKEIINEFAEKGGSSVKLCYLGEPLLYPYLKEAIQYAKDKGIIDVILATNGNLLTKEKAKEIINSRLDLIIFSIDSCHPKIYEQIRVNGNLKKVIQGLEFLNQLKEDYHSTTPKIQIQAIPMDLNREEIESGEYRDFFCQYADIIRISPFCEDYTLTKPIGETPNFFCDSVFQRMTIWANGNIAICCGARTNDKILGNIYQNSLEEIWLSDKFNEIRNLMKERKSHLIECCKTCTIRVHYV